jgi:hypothetical protein
MSHPEAVEQTALMQWARLESKAHPDLAFLFHIPNGQKLTGSTLQRQIRGARLKAQGVKAGVPDLFLPVPRFGRHGLFIELKAQGGRVSKEQTAWIDELSQRGYRACVCVGWLQARDEILDYLNPPTTYCPGVI